MQKWGLEWLWRIKEEPHLWKRYGDDGVVLLRLLLMRVLPLAIRARLQQVTWKRRGQGLSINQSGEQDSVILRLSGSATMHHTNKAIPCFRSALEAGKHITIDCTNTHTIDFRFLGLLLMLRKQLNGQGRSLRITGASRGLKSAFRLNGLGFLFSTEPEVRHTVAEVRNAVSGVSDAVASAV
jgi:N-acetylglucosaminyldiphosphoundecaprenol N-acetyl-beta-D-mannosaminyltransferase